MIKLCLSVAMTAILLANPFVAEAKRTFIMGLGDPLEGEMGAFGLRFQQIVKDRSNGELMIDLFPSGQLGDESEMIQNVAANSLDMAVVGVGNAVPFVEKLGVVTLPYIFPNMEAVVKGTTGQAQEILNSYTTKEASFRILGWVYNDYRHISNSKRPIKTIADVKGMKFRVPQNTVFIESYKSWGANPVAISWSETFTALQQGVVDGQCMGIITFQAVKFNEANQKYISYTHYTYHLQPLLISEELYQSLDDNEREILVEAALDAQLYTLAFGYENVARVKAELEAQGVQFDVIEDEDKWAEASKKTVWPEMMGFLGGKDTVNNYLKAAGLPEYK